MFGMKKVFNSDNAVTIISIAASIGLGLLILLPIWIFDLLSK